MRHIGTAAYFPALRLPIFCAAAARAARPSSGPGGAMTAAGRAREPCHQRELAHAQSRSQSLHSLSRCQQLGERALADLLLDRGCVRTERGDEGIRHGAMGRAVIPPGGRTAEPGPIEVLEHLLQGRQPDGVGGGRQRSFGRGERSPLLEREREAPAGSERGTARSPSRGALSGNASRVSSSSTTSNAAGGGGGIRETSKRHGTPAGALAGDVDGARADVDPQVGATEFAGDVAARAGHATAEVQRGHPRRDARGRARARISRAP